MANFKLVQIQQFADDNFKFDENIRKFPKQVENTVGKEEIARYKQFLLFPQCFQKACFPGVSKGVIVWEWVKPLTTQRNFKQEKETFENICVTRRKYWQPALSPPTMFSVCLRTYSIIQKKKLNLF